MDSPEIFIKRLYGAKALIKDAVILDQGLGHYIAFDYSNNEYEITMFAQSQVSAQPVWVLKLYVTDKFLHRTMLLFKRMIEHWEKMIPEEERSNARPEQPSILTTSSSNPADATKPSGLLRG
jgi:hypothetical protein